MIDLRNNFNIHDTDVVNFLNLSIEEIRMVLDWRNHENVKKWMYSDDDIALSEHINFIGRLAKDNSNFYWVVKNKDGIYIGTIYLNKADFKNKHVYMGIYTNPYNKIAGKGHLLIQCIKSIVFEIFSFHTLKLEVMHTNQKAINFYKKSGFSEEGRLIEFVFKDEQWHDVIVMGIVNRL